MGHPLASRACESALLLAVYLCHGVPLLLVASRDPVAPEACPLVAADGASCSSSSIRPSAFARGELGSSSPRSRCDQDHRVPLPRSPLAFNSFFSSRLLPRLALLCRPRQRVTSPSRCGSAGVDRSATVPQVFFSVRTFGLLTVFWWRSRAQFPAPSVSQARLSPAAQRPHGRLPPETLLSLRSPRRMEARAEAGNLPGRGGGGRGGIRPRGGDRRAHAWITTWRPFRLRARGDGASAGWSGMGRTWLVAEPEAPLVIGISTTTRFLRRG